MKTDLGLIQKITRLYTFYTPIKKGKYRLALASLSLMKDLPKQVVAKTNDGRHLQVNFDNHFAHFVYFMGEYEPAITKIIGTLIEPGDVCLDIGGNIGWFTTLLQKKVGKNGEVHTFEPVPTTFEVLKKNVKSNNNSEVVRLNNFALGESEGEVNLHLFDNLSDGHASISDFGQTDFKVYPCRVSTLNSYLKENKIENVKFVKVDVEGAELMMFKGATDLFRQKVPPIFEIEMALDTTRGFGYLPNDLVKFISSQSEYDFFAIDEHNCVLVKIDGFKPEDRGANVLCVPKGNYQNYLQNFEIKQ